MSTEGPGRGGGGEAKWPEMGTPRELVSPEWRSVAGGGGRLIRGAGADQLCSAGWLIAAYILTSAPLADIISLTEGPRGARLAQHHSVQKLL